MKKKNFILLCTLCTALLFSCNKEIETEIVDENPEDVVVPEGYTLMEFTAVCEETKTALDSDDTVWSEGDQIKIICSDYASNATLTAGAGTKTGTFAGMVPSGQTALYAVYPASAYDSVDGSTVKVTVPSDLTGSNTHPFGAGNIAVAKVEADHSMSFKNVTSLFSFTLAAGSNVTKVEISSVGDVGYLAGVVPVDCSEEETPPTPGVPLSGKATSISMATNRAGTYYMPIVSGSSHSKGLLLRFYKTEKNAYVQTGVYYLNRSIDIVNNNIYGFGTLETAGNYYVSPDGSGDKSGMNSENPMSFAQFKKKVTFTDNDEAVIGSKRAAVNGSTFHFSNDAYSIDSQLVIDMGSDVEFSIMGTVSDQDRTTFTCVASNKQGMIQVNSNTVNINNIKITGNSGNNNRAAIRVNAVNATLNLSNCVFENNLTADKGGAVWINQGKLNITDCEFTNNSAQYGAAILISNANSNSAINVTRGIFKGNHSNYGGAIYVIGDGSGTPSLTLTSCTFGGANSGEPNYAAYNGGAISINKGTVKIIGSSFIGNYVSSRNADETVDGGGAIYIAGSSDHPSILEQLSGSSFEANYANRFGGAIRLYGKATAKIYNTCIKGNHSANGGAIYTHKNKTTGVYPTLWLDRCDFDGNYISTNYGTTITVDAAEEFIMNNCAINDNTYNTAGTNETKSSWITIDNIQKACFSNCSFIGIPRQSATNALPYPRKEAILGIWTVEASGQVLLVNSIIVPSEGSNTYSMSSGDSGDKPVTLYYTWFGNNNKINVTNDGGNQSGKAKTDFSSMSWNASSHCWEWTGNVSDSDKATANDIIGKINTFSSGFRSWLGGDVYYDRRSLNNKKRGEGSSKWWPGCYQN